MRIGNSKWVNSLLALVTLLGLAAVASCGREEPFFEPGRITVTSSPAGAAIFLDGRDTGEVTPHTFADLPRDRYSIRVALPDFVTTPDSLTVDLAPADDLALDFALSRTGLTITSQPAGAAILLDGADTGRVTPATIAGLDAGAVDVSLVLDTFVVTPAAYAVTVVADSVINLPGDTFSLRAQRTVILEGFANVNCAPCPQLTANLLAMTAQPGFGPDRVLFFEYSVNWPNPSDPLYLHNTIENSDRFTDYFVLGAPSLYVNGVKLADPLDVDALTDAVTTGLQTDPGFRLAVEADFSNPTVTAAITLDPAVDVDLTGLILFVALYENEIDFDERGLTPGTNGQTVFHHVFRDRVDAPPALGALTAGTPVVHNVTLVRGDWPLDNLVVVAFVQDAASHAVIQAGSTADAAKRGSTASTGGNPR